jgi:hypothetical protein
LYTPCVLGVFYSVFLINLHYLSKKKKKKKGLIFNKGVYNICELLKQDSSQFSAGSVGSTDHFSLHYVYFSWRTKQLKKYFLEKIPNPRLKLREFFFFFFFKVLLAVVVFIVDL